MKKIIVTAALCLGLCSIAYGQQPKKDRDVCVINGQTGEGRRYDGQTGAPKGTCGPKESPGPKGPSAPAGPKGPSGPAGPKGSKGPSGVGGIRNDQGVESLAIVLDGSNDNLILFRAYTGLGELIKN